MIDRAGGRRAVERIKVDARDIVQEQFFALACGVVDADLADGFRVIFDGFNLRQQIRGQCGSAHLGESLYLLNRENRHDAGKNRRRDARRARTVSKAEEIIVVENGSFLRTFFQRFSLKK